MSEIENAKKTKNFPLGEICPVRNILSRLGDKWSMLVVITLHDNEVMRFNEIHRSLGDISHRMLTITLRTLEEDGLVSRKLYAEVPPRVEYRLTEMGESLIPHFQRLVDWAITHSENIMQHRTGTTKYASI